jgi:uncharacterized protein YoxC
MSDSQAYEEVTVASDGVTVTKRFEADEFPVPAIAFNFESRRNEAVTVHLVDVVPEGVAVEDLGFHPEYGSEFWTIDETRVTFERELEGESEYTTVYGIRATGSDNVQQFLTEPVIEEVDPPLPEGESVGDVIPESDDDVVKDAIAGDGEIPGLEEDEEETEETDEDVTLNLNDPNNEGEEPAQDGTSAGEGEAADDGDTSGGGGGSVALENGSLTAALANEIREQNVSGEDLKLLRRALEVAAQQDAQKDGVNEARIEQLQSDISDLRAYTGALEEFLDENGTGDEMIQEFESQLESFDDRLQSVQSEIESNSDQVESVSQEVSSMSETVSQVDEEMDALGEEVDSVSGEMESVKEDVDGVSAELDTVESSIADLEGQVQELEEQVSEGDLAQEIEDIQQEIENLQTWQEQIKETFGG